MAVHRHRPGPGRVRSVHLLDRHLHSMRCYEQVRNGAVLHHWPVRVVEIGGGYAYGHAAQTHRALEDLAIARPQPGLTVLVPADPAQTRTIVRATMDLPGPAYLRVGKGGNAEVPGLGGRFALGRPEVVREGSDVLFLTCGSVVHEALAAARDLDADKVSAAVAVLAHLPPASARPVRVDPSLHVRCDRRGGIRPGPRPPVAEAIVEQGLGARLERRASGSRSRAHRGVSRRQAARCRVAGRGRPPLPASPRG